MSAAEGNVTPLRRTFTLDAGGATVDTSKLGSVKFAAGTKDLEQQFKKGSDVRMIVTARVTGVVADDKYDAHDHVSETIREHRLRVDSIESIELIRAKAFKTAAEAQAEADAADELERSGGTLSLAGDEPDPDPDPDPDDLPPDEGGDFDD